MNINIFDSHVHSDNSFDGHNSVTRLCEIAVQKGISGIAITDHCDINYYDTQRCGQRMKDSFFECAIARDVFRNHLAVSSGMEIGQPFENLELSEEIINRHDFDFILASIHNILDEDDFYYLDYRSMSREHLDMLMERYFEELLKMTAWGQFDVIAHMTYPLRHIIGRYNIPIDMRKFKPQTDMILKKLAETGKGLELNVSGLRTHGGILLPTMDYFVTFKEMGGEIVTIVSDKNRASDIGEHISKGMELLSEIGYKYFAFYKERKATMLRII